MTEKLHNSLTDCSDFAKECMIWQEGVKSTMQPILRTADPLPFKSHPCPLFCLQTPAGEQHVLLQRAANQMLILPSTGWTSTGEINWTVCGEITGFLQEPTHITALCLCRYRCATQKDFQNSTKPAPPTSVPPILSRPLSRRMSCGKMMRGKN